jgi:hypothetical protein
VRASNDPKQTWIGSRTILGVVYDQLHLAADELESRFHLEFQNIAVVARKDRVGQKRLQRPCFDQVVKPVPIHSDLDVLRSDVDHGVSVMGRRLLSA